MNFNPEEVTESEGRAQPGKYRFKVDDAQETVFTTGREGIKVKLLVGVGDRDITVFFNLVNTPKALWRIREFMASIGLDFSSGSCDPRDMYGRTGEAEFVEGDKGYLEVGQFLPAKANNAPQRRPASQPASEPQYTDGNVPF